ncbi:hypothetical protein BVX99_01525 [bacterium F16]|nr:hypothetical protein BVX99_01525 [bacterium F16]
MKKLLNSIYLSLLVFSTGYVSYSQVKPRSISLTETFKNAKKQVYINEIAIRSASFGKPSWIELWNNRDERVNLKGYTLQSMTCTEKIKQDLWIKAGGFALVLIYPGTAANSKDELNPDLVIENKNMFELLDIESKFPAKYIENLKTRFPDPKKYRETLIGGPLTHTLLANELALISSSMTVESYCIWDIDTFRFMKPHPSRVKKAVREKVNGIWFRSRGQGGDCDDIRVLMTKPDTYGYIEPCLPEEDTPGADLFLPATPPQLEFDPDKRHMLRAKPGHIGPYQSLSLNLFGGFRYRLAYDRDMQKEVLTLNKYRAASMGLEFPYVTIVDRMYLSGRTLYIQAGYLNKSLGDCWGAPVELKFPYFNKFGVLNSLISFEKEDIAELDKPFPGKFLLAPKSGEYVKINYLEKPPGNRSVIALLRQAREQAHTLVKLDSLDDSLYYGFKFSRDYTQIKMEVSHVPRKWTDLKSLAPIPLTGTLDLTQSKVDDLSPLAGKNGITLHLPPTAKLNTLKNLKLGGLHLHGTPVPKGFRLINNGVTVESVTLDNVDTENLNLIEGQDGPIEINIIGDIKDLSAVKELKLRGFSLESVTGHDLRDLASLSALKGKPLKKFRLNTGQQYDLAFLVDMPLTHLYLDSSLYGSWKKVLNSIIKRQTLTHLGLRRGYKLTSLREFAGLKLEYLDLSNCNNLRSELDELEGMPLQELNLTSCATLRLENLKMLERAPLKKLFLKKCHVADISALLRIKDLEEITLPERCENIEVLAKHATLKRIDGQLANDFWKHYKEGGRKKRAR